MSGDLGPALEGGGRTEVHMEGGPVGEVRGGWFMVLGQRAGLSGRPRHGPAAAKFPCAELTEPTCRSKVPFASESYCSCFFKAVTNSLLYPQKLPLLTQWLLCTQLHPHCEKV